MKKRIRIDLLSRAHHLNQPLTGFHRWAKLNGYALEIRDCTAGSKYRVRKTALVAAVDGLRLVYDMADGYQSPEAMESLLGCCDFYFKRSFSEDVNQAMGYRKVYPYGLNYDVTWAGNPLTLGRKAGMLRTAWETVSGRLVTPEKMEQPSGREEKGVLFLARLWREEPGLTPAENRERREINRTRIRLLRTLKEMIGESVIGGLRDDPVAAEMAPDLVLPARLTNRNRYLALMRRASVCVATTGLHGSIGWKFGEYIAAGRAVVSESLRYTVPGPFREETNYLSFAAPEECAEQVRFLLSHPEKIRSMQESNREYARDYLKPERLIGKTLETAGIRGKETGSLC